MSLSIIKRPKELKAATWVAGVIRLLHCLGVQARLLAPFSGDQKALVVVEFGEFLLRRLPAVGMDAIRFRQVQGLCYETVLKLRPRGVDGTPLPLQR